LSLTLFAAARTYGEVERQRAVAEFARDLPARQVDFPKMGEVARHEEPLPAARVPDQAHWSASRIRAFAARAYDATAPVALLRIDSVDVEVPVYVDANERNLNRGAGLVPGTAPPGSDGNIAIAAHRDGYFRALERVVVGDVLELETPSLRRRYRVAEITIVEPTDMRPLLETGVPTVTLVTCYPFYFVGNAPRRYIVRALALQ
jgi:LPXTG-site transpeptidase (sortase) family protein